MKQLEKYIAEQIDTYKKNFRDSGTWWFGFQEAMEIVLKYLEEGKKKNVEKHRKRWTP